MHGPYTGDWSFSFKKPYNDAQVKVSGLLVTARKQNLFSE